MADADARIEEAVDRSITIAAEIAGRADVRIREEIEGYTGRLGYRKKLEQLAIDGDAYRRVKAAKIRPRLVFAHPKLLVDMPNASLYYRGIALLPRKRVAGIAGTVDGWEQSPPTARITKEKARRLARLYNRVISAVVLDRSEWGEDDAPRNVLVNVGITADGGMRNVVGQQAEAEIKGRMREFAVAEGLAVGALDDPTCIELRDGVTMRFGSEPDIGFERNESWALIIEIKGGKDPAGALERLGAIKKTFDEAPNDCRNFLVVGVVTTTMRERLREMRMESYFDIDELRDPGTWEEFMNEIFHHSLRIAPEIGVQRDSS